MEMLQVGGAKKYHKYSDKNQGDVLIDKGEYIGSVEGKYGVQWKFRNPDTEEITVLNSAGQLNYLMEQYVSEGDVVTVIYDGQHEIPKGAMKGKMAHQFKVLKAKSGSESDSQTLGLDDLE